MIAIRADVNNIIASGHVTRCLVIAEEIMAMGEECLFISSDDAIKPFLENKGVQLEILDADWKDKEKELPKLLEVLKHYGIQKILVDSYQVTENYFRELSRHVSITYFDELGFMGFGHCTNLINGMIAPPSYMACVGNALLGPAFVPLRKEFQGLPQKHANQSVKTILISSGGSDPYDFLGCFLGRWKKEPVFSDARLEVIVGALNNKKEELKNLENNQIKVYVNTNKMRELLWNADLAVLAGGMTIYEACACGTPGIIYGMADNQIEQCKAFDRLGIMPYAGDVRNGMYEALDQVFVKIKEFAEPRVRERITAKMQSLVDGNGAKRIAGAIIKGD